MRTNQMMTAVLATLVLTACSSNVNFREVAAPSLPTLPEIESPGLPIEPRLMQPEQPSEVAISPEVAPIEPAATIPATVESPVLYATPVVEVAPAIEQSPLVPEVLLPAPTATEEIGLTTSPIESSQPTVTPQPKNMVLISGSGNDGLSQIDLISPQRIQVPASLQVVSGEIGNHKVTLSFDGMECDYRVPEKSSGTLELKQCKGSIDAGTLLTVKRSIVLEVYGAKNVVLKASVGTF